MELNPLYTRRKGILLDEYYRVVCSKGSITRRASQIVLFYLEDQGLIRIKEIENGVHVSIKAFEKYEIDMKIIFSRKGFDSKYGGYPSPILPDGTLLSLPIPSEEKIHYSDLKADKQTTYFDIMKQLKLKIKWGGEWEKLTKRTPCHLDPDIRATCLNRKAGWKPCFGQIGASQTHLANEGVKQGDLFLFFGWFQKTIIDQGKLRFDIHSPDLHVIFGYLQIGKIVKLNTKFRAPEWMASHPHAEDSERRENPKNTLYIVKENLSWNNHLKGAGVFNFSDNLVLTKKGYSRSKWALPECFRKVRISRHSADSWKEEGFFKSVDIGQEIVIEDNEEIEKWAMKLIDHSCR